LALVPAGSHSLSKSSVFTLSHLQLAPRGPSPKTSPEGHTPVPAPAFLQLPHEKTQPEPTTKTISHPPTPHSLPLFAPMSARLPGATPGPWHHHSAQCNLPQTQGGQQVPLPSCFIFNHTFRCRKHCEMSCALVLITIFSLVSWLWYSPRWGLGAGLSLVWGPAHGEDCSWKHHHGLASLSFPHCQKRQQPRSTHPGSNVPISEPCPRLGKGSARTFGTADFAPTLPVPMHLRHHLSARQ
jgi:hypothetical protein